MMERTHLISASWIILLVVLYKVKDVNSTCPSLFSIEKGHNATVGCNITDIPSITFWYIGSPSRTSPILSLSNNQKSGTMYGNSRFDISSWGDMLIFNTQVEDEATYTVVYFNKEGNHQQGNITVEIRVHPKQQCPEIARCTSCSNCSLQINQTGELICSVTGSRPKLSLQWDISHIDNLQFTSHESQWEEDDVTGTWDSKISAKYSISKCGAFAVIRCVVQDNPELIKQPFSDITLRADSCLTDKPNGDPSMANTNSFLQPVVIILVVVCLVLVLALCFMLVVMTIKKKRRKDGLQLQNTEDNEAGLKLMPCDPNQQTDQNIPKSDNEKKQKFVSFLSENYQQYCYITLFAGEEARRVHIDELYVESQCLVKWKNGSYQMMTTDEAMGSKLILNEESIILTGDIGLGKTTFFSQMINKWTQEENKTYILLYIQLNEINYQKDLVDIVMDEKPPLSREDVENVLLNEPVVALIDGLSELSVGKDCTPISTLTSELSARKLSSKKPVEGNNKIRTWTALRQTNISFSQIPSTIELVGFNREQTDKLETKILSYRHQYAESHDRNQERNCTPATGPTLLKNGALFEERKRVKDFPNVPLFLTTLSYNHIFTNKGEEHKLTQTMSKIVETITGCLARHYDAKQHNASNKTSNSSLGSVIDNDFLEQLSKCISKSVTELKQVLGKDKLDRAFAIGLLRKATTDKEDFATFRYPFLGGLFYEDNLLQLFEDGKFFINDETRQSVHFRLALMQFCALPNEDLKSKALKTLRERGMWDDFIDCFSELKDSRKRRKQIEESKGSKEIMVTNLDDIYHQDNLEVFLSELKRLNYVIGTLILKGQFRVAILTKLMQPDFVRIVFSNAKIKENDTEFIVEWILKTIKSTSSKHKTRTFQFHDCFINLTTAKEVLKRQANFPEFCIEISSGTSWKNSSTTTTYTMSPSRKLNRENIPEYESSASNRPTSSWF